MHEFVGREAMGDVDVGDRGLDFSFFFQAEDGIRDHCVTGVQTCALPISSRRHTRSLCDWSSDVCSSDRKSTRLNSSHTVISYAVFCLRSEEHTSELQSHSDLVCLLLEIGRASCNIGRAHV